MSDSIGGRRGTSSLIGIEGEKFMRSIALAVGAALAFAALTVEARTTRIEITSVESPTFEGRTFGEVGAYEKLRGKAYGELEQRRLLLPGDVQRYIDAAEASDVLR